MSGLDVGALARHGYTSPLPPHLEMQCFHAKSGSGSKTHCFRSAGQLVIRVSGSVMDCGRTVFITNFLPSAETA